jgi:hypothetical protein
MLPFVMPRIGADPVASSAPFIATLVDVTGSIIYFSIALVIMRGVMLYLFQVFPAVASAVLSGPIPGY